MKESRDMTGSLTFGFIFIVLGMLFLLDALNVFEFAYEYVLPIILMIVGIVVLIGSRSRN